MIRMYEAKPFSYRGEDFSMDRRLFSEPRCYTGIMTAIGISGLAISAAGIGLNASGALDPTQPNLAQSSAQMAQTEATLLPYILAEEAAAQEGGTINQTYLSPAQQKEQAKLQAGITSTQKQIQQLQSATPEGGPRGALNPNQAEITRLQTELTSQQNQLEGIKGTPIKGDFTGESTADIQGQIQKAEAAGQIALQQQYDPQFIAEALAQEKLANPQGVAARATEQNLIQQGINNPPSSPVSDAMEKQIEGQVNAGSNLTPQEEQMLASTIADANASGAGASSTGFENALTGGLAGTQRELANAGAGEAWLSSGQTPEDIAYQQNQQNMANLASYIGGATPQSQFNSLQTASQGATPTPNNAVLSTMPGNAQSLGSGAAVNNYEEQFSQANPWITGLSGVLGGLNVAGAAGFKPFATTP